MAITRLNNNSITSITALPSGLVSAGSPYWSARETGLQTINHSTEIQATLGTVLVDSDSGFSSGTYTVPSGKGGVYFTWWQIDLYDADADITNLTAIIKINDTTKSKIYIDGTKPSHQHNSVNYIGNLSAGDTIKYYAYMTTTDAGSAQLYGGEFGTMCGGFRLV